MWHQNIAFVKYILKNNKKFFIVSLITNIVRGFSLAFANVLFLKILFDAIEANKDFMDVLEIIIIYAVYQIGVSLLYNWQWHYFEPIQKEKLAYSIKKDIFGRCQKIGLAQLDDSNYYENYKWCLDGIVQLSENVIRTWCDLFNNLSSLIVVLVVLIQIDYKLIIISMITFILVYLLDKRIVRIEMKNVDELNYDKRKADYINRTFYLKDYSKDIRLSNVKSILFDSFKKSSSRMYSIQKKNSKNVVKLAILRNMIMFMLGFLLMIMFVLHKYIVVHCITLGGITAVLNSIWRFSENMEGINNSYESFSVFSVYIEKIRNFMDNAGVTEKLLAENEVQDMPEVIKKIEFKNVSFRYSNAKEDTIKNVNLEIRGGQKIAIVGRNGNGKSTLVKLLTRLYRPSEGEILINGININYIKAESFYMKIGCILQNFQIFAASVSENVKMDLINAVDRDEVYKCLDLFGLSEKIKSFKRAENTNLTKEYDPEGTELSGGQGQRLAVARLFFRNEKSLIVLDEPTSSLDAYAEYQLNKEIMENVKDKTIVLITHRLSTVVDADLILYIKNGNIVEVGNHKQLMDKNGEYAELFKIQASKYKTNIT